MLAHRESAALAQRLIAESCRKQDIEPDQLTVHADRGSSMRSKSVALLLGDLGVTKTLCLLFIHPLARRELKPAEDHRDDDDNGVVVDKFGDQ